MPLLILRRITTSILFGNGYGDPALVVDRTTGTILCIFNGENGFWGSTSDNPQKIFVCKSTDNGQTWSPKIDITAQLYAKNCSHPERQTWQGLFVTAGAAVQLRSGRILAVANVRAPTNSNDSGVKNYAIYSDDGGDTWDVSINSPGLDAAEAKIAERNNGDLLMSTRHVKNRWFSISKNKGLTWEPYSVSQEIIEPGCNGDMVLYTSIKDGFDKNRLLHSIPFSQTSRSNISILISYDEGQTWPVKKPIYTGNAEYSSVSFLPDGRFAVYIEKRNSLGGYDMNVTTFTLEWLTDGADTYTPPKKLNK